MGDKLKKHQVGMTLAIAFAVLHALWAISVALGIAETYLNWILPLHFIQNIVPIISFNIVSAILLVIVAFICGYVVGWLFAWLYNAVGKMKCCK